MPTPPAPAAAPSTGAVLLTSAEVAELLRVDVYTVRRYVRAGALPAYRIGRELRVSSHDLDAWLQARAVVAR